MKRKVITGLVTAGLLAGVAWADDKKVEVKASTDGDKSTTIGEKLDNAGEKVKDAFGRTVQGAKNMVADVKMEELPEAVQKTIKEHSGGATISDIDREDRTGKTVYEVEFAKDGKDSEIHVSEDGTLVQEEQQVAVTGSTSTDTDRTSVRAKADDNRNPKFSDLPAAVQATARQHGSEAQVGDVDRYVRNGKTVYEIEFRREGMNKEVHIDESGAIWNDKSVGVGSPGSDTRIEGSTSTTDGKPRIKVESKPSEANDLK